VLRRGIVPHLAAPQRASRGGRVSRYGSSFAAGVCIALRATPDEGVWSYTNSAVTTRFLELLP